MSTVLVAPLMWVSVLLCFLVAALKPVCGKHLTTEVQYECGQHGKFEYCIDGIPGCVIGCHCHPGYYFDTDTKICEPNAKLTQDFRRHYLPEPTRVPDFPIIPTATDAFPVPTPTDKGDEIPKDTDDLGDWLYNQFFKTIENQIFNNMSNTKLEITNTEKPPSRRSGDNNIPMIVKSKKKTRKFLKGGRRKKHMKRHGLRKKLLRITEDDSLFDSNSDSDYSDSDDSDSDSDDSSDLSDTDDSSEKSGKDDKDDKYDKSDKDDQDHGHKKVIIFNRRPKVPLPSFIFLPSMDTPYYPPIGLPPPPMPMYPMIPVPPIAFPMPGTSNCNGDETKTTNGAATSTTASTASTESTGTTKATTDASTPPTPAEPAEPEPSTPSEPSEPPDESATTTGTDTTPGPGDRRSRLNKLRKKQAQVLEPGSGGKLKHGLRNNLANMQRVQEKRRHRVSLSDAETPDGFEDEDMPNSDDILNSFETLKNYKKKRKKNSEEQHIPKLEDVDFKYLSELIHRVNQSDARKRLGSLPSVLTNDLKELEKLRAQHTRRNFDSYMLQPNVQPESNPFRTLHKQAADDTYYSNLGRQIASMIRNADNKADHQFNKDAQLINHQVPYHPVLNEHSNIPPSFWERSIRSPLPQVGAFTNYLDESRTLRHSNEKSLLNLENEVELFASTRRPLSLQDLENILNTMEKAQAHIKYSPPTANSELSNVSFNVNLLPKYVRTDNMYRRLYKAPEQIVYINEKQTHTKIPNASALHDPETKSNVPFTDYWIYKNNLQPVQLKPQLKPVLVTKIPIMKLYYKNNTQKTINNNPVYKTNSIMQPSVTLRPLKYAAAKKSLGGYLRFLNPHAKQTTQKRLEPAVVNYKSLNYFTDNKHHYMFETNSFPLLSPIKSHVSRKYGNPSYFHHQSHHFEYFDS